MTRFRAFQVTKNPDGGDGGAPAFARRVVERSVDALPAGELLIDVAYSSLNYKDALSAIGNPGVSRDFPHTPGIDAAGVVVESADRRFAVGDEVVVIGFNLGMNTPGGFAQKIRVPADWAVRLPKGLSARAAMILGTAGFTAGLAVHKLRTVGGMLPSGGPVLVTGATGGVGSVAVALLSKLDYEVHAATGKGARHDYLRDLGAAEVLDRDDALAGAERPLGRQVWGGVVDVVGGPILANAIKSVRYGASVAACGLAASADLPITVLPFILRHVNLLGIDSAEYPTTRKAEIWEKLAAEWRVDLERVVEPLTLETLSGAIDRVLAGEMVGRGLVDPNA